METSASFRGCLEDQPVISMASKKCLGRSNCLIDVVWTNSTSGGAATSAFMRTKLGFVSSDEDMRGFFEHPLFQLIVTALPASSGRAASISGNAIAASRRRSLTALLAAQRRLSSRCYLD